MKPWQPRMYKGVFYDDPRGELRARAMRGKNANDTNIVVPVDLALACVDLIECGANTTLKGDEQGAMAMALMLSCRKPMKHSGQHYNGYAHWNKQEGE